MIDSFGRDINYLRVSVTKRCNLNCSYCGTKSEAGEELTPVQIEKIVRAFADCGMWSVTFMGNAPEIASNAFENVQCSAFYPQSAEGWNRKATVPYGGALTWEAMAIQ